MTLTDLANKYGTDKGTRECGTRHDYTLTYEKFLEPLRNNTLNLLELGVVMEGTGGGHSLKMWYEYFTRASLYALM